MKRALFIVVLALIVAAYLFGFWPQRVRAKDAEAREQQLQQALTAAEAKAQLGAVLGQLLRLEDAVNAHNYGNASTFSSAYFDAVRAAEGRVIDGGARQALQQVQQNRDQVTAALARSDPSIAVPLKDQELQLRKALGYPVEPTPVAAPPQ